MMSAATLKRCALAVCVAALFAGCGVLRQAQDDMQPPIGAPGAMLQVSSSATHAGRGKSWMLPGTKTRNLLYVSVPYLPDRDVYVYSYPRLERLGVLTDVAYPMGECVDKAGNVFIADSYSSAVYEYRHGDTTPTATVKSPGVLPMGCSIDPTTGALAVSGEGKRDAVISIYAYNAQRGWRFPKTYRSSTMVAGYLCSYDDQGNLYVDGVDEGHAFELAELSKGSTTLASVTLNQTIKVPGQVQWDGQYLAIGDAGKTPSVVYQFSVSGSSGTVVGSTTLTGSKTIEQFWIQAKKVIGPDDRNSKGSVGFWSYPRGGNRNGTINLYNPFGATVSPGK